MNNYKNEIKDSADLQIISRRTGKPVLMIDYANTFSISLSADSTSVKKKGKDAITWNNAKEGTVTIGVEMLNSSLMAFLLGAPTLNEVVKFYKREVFDIDSVDEVVTLAKTPKTGSVTAFKIRKDGSTHISELASPTVSTNNVTLVGSAVGDKVAVYYLTEEQANHFAVAGDRVLTEDYKIVAVTTTKLYESGEEVPIEIEIFKASPEENIEFTFDSETPSTFEITMKMMVDENDKMFDWKEIPLE